MMNTLSKKTESIIQKMFEPNHIEEAKQLLATECGKTLPWHGESNENELERVRFAILKLSQGNLSDLLSKIQDAKQDWRDTLMAAGFGHSLNEHTLWADRYLLQK